MTLRMTFTFSISLLGLLCLLPGPVRADTVYTYTGNPYTSCDGAYASSGTTCLAPYALSLTFDTTLSGSQLASFSGDITPDVTSFLMTDGGDLSISQTGPYYINQFFIDTAADGSMMYWQIQISTSATLPFTFGYTANLEDNSGVQFFDSVHGATELANGFLLNAAGKWVGGPDIVTSVPTPEPSSLLLLGTGLLALIGLRSRRNCQTTRG